MGVFGSHSYSHHEQVLFCSDKESGLKAIIAIHDTTLGPALGGCRFWNYNNDSEALEDVLRLSRGMTYKAAVAGLNLGGGKAVIIGDASKLKNEGLLRSFGRFVNSLSGRYITAEDVNMSVKDIEYVGSETSYVTGVSSGSGDPSPVTALGVFVGIQASVKHALKQDSLEGIRVAVQGVGAVGNYLCQYLSHKGAKLFIADIDKNKLSKVCEKYGATAVGLDEIHKLDVEVFAPCALGAGLNDTTIPHIKAKIIAGAANNQLLDENKHGSMIRDRNILYAPDYVINAGGLINVYQELCGYNAEAARTKTEGIYGTLLEIYEISEKESISTQQASDRIAERRIQGVRRTSDLRNTLGNQKWRRKS